MLTRIAVAALAAGALACHVPVAHAAPPVRVECGTEPVTREIETGTYGDFVVGVYGYIVGDPAETSVSVSCELRVDGAAARSTPAGTGRVVAATRGVIVYDAVEPDAVDVCAVWTTSTHSGEACEPLDTMQIPPQEVFDLVAFVLSIVNGDN